MPFRNRKRLAQQLTQIKTTCSRAFWLASQKNFQYFEGIAICPYYMIDKSTHILVLASFVVALGCSRPEPRLSSITNQDGIAILEDTTKVLFYQIKPKSLNGKFERASYIHPLYSLDGTVITEDFPEDHLHHHGIYSAWHQILVNDELIGDGWMGENISWEVTNAVVTNDDNRIAIVSEVLWKGLVNDKKEAIVRENLEIIVHESNDKLRIIDYNFDLVPLRDSIRIGGSDDAKGYGGFSLRFKLPDDIRFMADEGEVQAKVESVEAGPWMDFTGSFDGEGSPAGGVLVICHPSNPGSPEPWILRKQRSMQNAAFPGRAPAELPKEGLEFQYRLIIHKGDLNKEAIEEMYKEYAGD